ncbi:MAG: hypothetical protein JXR83_05630 [Deltaproteobacteria bacterium]|nr:hypothetical protein [Deltaproteobacteria bacterium]
MELRRDIQLAVGIFIAFLLVTAFAAIGLLGRMSPAIKRILSDNVASVTACEDMLHVLALADGSALDVEQAAWFESSLARVRQNITEESERPVIEEIARLVPQVAAGDVPARHRVVAALRQLATINRDAMYRADARARRFSVAGTWAMVFLALLGFGAGIGIARRFSRRILLPLSELHQVFVAARRGESHRRCARLAAPIEIAGAMTAANALLDQCEAAAAAAAPHYEPIDRAAAIQLLDAQTEPLAVVDDKGEVVLANQAALDALSGPAGTAARAALHEATADKLPPGLARVTPIKNVHAWLCALQT